MSIQTIINETGTPAGWYPLINGYDALPPLPANYNLLSLPQELLDYLVTLVRITLLAKSSLVSKPIYALLYEAGPGAKNVEQEENSRTN